MSSDLRVAKAVARTTFARLARVVSAGALSGAGVDEGSLAGRLPMPSICRLVDLVRQTTGFGEDMFGDAVGQAALAAMAAGDKGGGAQQLEYFQRLSTRVHANGRVDNDARATARAIITDHRHNRAPLVLNELLQDLAEAAQAYRVEPDDVGKLIPPASPPSGLANGRHSGLANGRHSAPGLRNGRTEKSPPTKNPFQLVLQPEPEPEPEVLELSRLVPVTAAPAPAMNGTRHSAPAGKAAPLRTSSAQKALKMTRNVSFDDDEPQSRPANGPTAAGPAKMKKPYRKSLSTGALSREDSAPIPAGLGERVRKEGLWEGKSEAGEANGKGGAGMAKGWQKLQSKTLLQQSVNKVILGNRVMGALDAVPAEEKSIREKTFDKATMLNLKRSLADPAKGTSKGKWQAAATRLMLGNQIMTASKIDEDLVNEIFTRFDHSGDDNIDFRELKHALNALGFGLSFEEVRQIMKKYDDDDNAEISRSEFHEMVNDIGRKTSNRDKMKRMMEMSRDLKNEKVDHREVHFTQTDRNQTVKVPWYIRDPESPFSCIWDGMQMFLLIWVAFTVTARVGFDLEDAPPDKWYFWVDVTIDVYFLVDLVLQMFTAFHDERGMKVVDAKVIRTKYFKSWFLIDLVSGFPIQYIALYVFDNDKMADNTDNLRTMKIVRMIKLVKLLRIVRAVRIIKRHEDQLIPLAKSIGAFFTIALILHMLACFWYMAGLTDDSADDKTSLCSTLGGHNGGERPICGNVSRQIRMYLIRCCPLVLFPFGNTLAHIGSQYVPDVIYLRALVPL